jgi:hypothetical protein
VNVLYCMRIVGRGMEREFGVVIEVDAIPWERVVTVSSKLPPLRKQRRCDGRPTAGRTCRIARPPLNLDLGVRLAEIYLAISHDGHSILLHLGNPAYPLVSVPERSLDRPSVNERLAEPGPPDTCTA